MNNKFHVFFISLLAIANFSLHATKLNDALQTLAGKENKDQKENHAQDDNLEFDVNKIEHMQEIQKTIALLQQPTPQKLSFKKKEQSLADIVRATIFLADEIKRNDPNQQISVDEMTAFTINNNPMPYHAISKSDSYGFFVPLRRLSMWMSRGFTEKTPNNYSITITPSLKHFGFFEIQINADGVCDTINQDLQKCHNDFTKVLRSIDSQNQKTEYIYYSPDQNELKGEITGPKCAYYGCTKNITIYCPYHIFAKLVQEKNSSKYDPSSLPKQYFKPQTINSMDSIINGLLPQIHETQIPSSKNEIVEHDQQS